MCIFCVIFVLSHPVWSFFVIRCSFFVKDMVPCGNQSYIVRSAHGPLAFNWCPQYKRPASSFDTGHLHLSLFLLIALRARASDPQLDDLLNSQDNGFSLNCRYKKGAFIISKAPPSRRTNNEQRRTKSTMRGQSLTADI